MERTIAALYEDRETAQHVVDALIEAGFSGDDISILARETHETGIDEDWDVTPGEGFGFGALVGAFVGIVATLVPGIGPLVGVGPLAVALTAGIGAAAGAVTGGLTATLIDLGIDEDRVEYFTEGLRRGGTLVSLTTQLHWLEWAENIMKRYDPLKVEERGDSWISGDAPVFRTRVYTMSSRFSDHSSGNIPRAYG